MQASVTSDYDLAIAFTDYINDPFERRLRPELLALSWTKKLNTSLSIIDINQASYLWLIPLFKIIQLFTELIITVVWLRSNKSCQNGN